MPVVTLQRLWDRVALIGAIGFLVAIAVTGLDIVGRLSGTPIVRGAIDMVRICTVISGAFAIAMTAWRDSNVRVEIFSAGMPAAVSRWLDRTWRLMAAVLFGLIAWRCFVEALHSNRVGEVMPSLEIAAGTLGLIICVGFGLGAVAAILSVVSGDAGPEREPDP